MKTSPNNKSLLLGPMALQHFSPPLGRAFLLALLFSLLPIQPLSASTSDLPLNELAWRYHCTTCHGDNGVASSDRYPNLSGQNALYLESRLKYFRARTEHRNQMNAQAVGLTDEEISRLAKYFSLGGRVSR